MGCVPAPLAPLQRYLRALWNVSPGVSFDAETPFIAAGAIHLPPRVPPAAQRDAWRWYCAAATHAAAHLVYSPPVLDGRGLGPIVRALVGVLEDARVEALACRQLPGLRRLWLPLHSASVFDGEGAEALLLRLARALADEGYADPHPWVMKGRRMFYADTAQQVMALPGQQALRHAASLLGNDLGQMRLQINPKLYVPGPAYRDDHRWLWPQPDRPPTGVAAVEPVGTTTLPEPMREFDAVHRYPEWDCLIERLRRDWCTVVERPVAQQTAEQARQADVTALSHHPLRAPTRRALQHLRIGARRTEVADSGERFEPDALVRARMSQRLRRTIDPRVHRTLRRAAVEGRALVLIDQSASTAARWGEAGKSLLHASRETAALVAGALQASGIGTALYGFQSNGRHEVRLHRVKAFDGPMDAAVLSRLLALRSGCSTRLGVALRHAARCLQGSGWRGVRLLVVVSDGQPHDIDVHDGRYLIEDATRAVADAERAGIAVVCLALDAATLDEARRVFSHGRLGLLRTMAGLPSLLRRLLG